MHKKFLNYPSVFPRTDGFFLPQCLTGIFHSPPILSGKSLSPSPSENAHEFAPHWDRYDHSSFMLRSSFPRLQFKNQATVQDSGFGDKKEAKEDKSIPHHDCGKKVFTRGDILVVNDNLAHYRGELEVVLTEIPNDGERNLIGKIKDEDLGLLDFIKPGQHFKFIK